MVGYSPSFILNFENILEAPLFSFFPPFSVGEDFCVLPTDFFGLLNRFQNWRYQQAIIMVRCYWGRILGGVFGISFKIIKYKLCERIHAHSSSVNFFVLNRNFLVEFSTSHVVLRKPTKKSIISIYLVSVVFFRLFFLDS